jgi:hypothetical protein
MAYRKLHINKTEWHYTVGRSNVHIKGPNGVNFNCPTRELATPIHCSCGPEYNCYDTSAVKPGDIKRFVESKIKK